MKLTKRDMRVRQFLFGMMLLPLLAWASAGVEQQIDQLIPIYQKGDIASIKSATDELGFIGISSPRLFDVVEQRLLAGYQQGDKAGIEMSGWLIKALSYSGNEKYRGTLEKIVSGGAPKKVTGYASRALPVLSTYGQWNPEISKNLQGLDGDRIDVQRVKNMLGSSNLELVRQGARRLYAEHQSNKELLNIADKLVLAGYQSPNSDKLYVDTMAWLCRGLAASGDSAYIETVRKVAEGASDRKLQKYAKKYLAGA